MNKTLDIAAKILSVVLYPLFVPTYGMILFCWAHSLHVAPLPWIWVVIALVGTFLLTCIIPITAIWIMIRRGQVADIQIANANERTMPYIYTIFGFGCWAYLIISVNFLLSNSMEGLTILSTFGRISPVGISVCRIISSIGISPAR